MTSEAPDSLTPRARLPPASRVLVAALVCLLLATPGAVAQSRYSALVAVGFGAVPAERRHASVAGPVVLFRRLVPAAVGIEGAGLGRLRWILMARAHGAVGGMSGEMASVSTYTVTAGLTLR